MSGNPIRRAMAAGEPTFGAWLAIDSTLSAEGLARQGYEWLAVDTQHGGVTMGSLGGIIQAVELGGSRAVVRVGSNDPRLIMRALDLGAAGIIVPLVSTPEQARTAAAAMRYPPDGERSFGPVRRFYALEEANADVVCLVMIETAEGLANVDEIAATPGVDGLFVGPMDLALSLGLPFSLQVHDDVMAAMERVASACEKTGKIAGAVSMGGHANAEELLKRGMRLVTLGADILHINAGARADIEAAARFRTQFARPA